MYYQKYLKYKTKYQNTKMNLNGGESNTFVKQYVYIRHGERPSLQKDQEIKEKWKNSQRYEENNRDEPLTEKGFKDSYETGVKLLDQIDINNFDYIYSSPWTRCVQTSIQILQAIKDNTNKTLKIRIEYGLAEQSLSFSLFYLPEISNGKIVGDTFPNYIARNDKREIVPLMDEKLHYSNLLKIYSEYLDLNHKPLFSETDVNNCNVKKEWQMQLSIAKMITKQPKSYIIVSHGTNQALYPQCYLLNIKEPNVEQAIELMNGTEGPTNVNFVMIYQLGNDKKWKRILSPQRII